MRYLRYGSVILLLSMFCACGAPYTHLSYHKEEKGTALIYKPVFEKKLYRCVVDGKILFKKFHLSGLLFFKTLEDKTTRVIFQNEMGLSFFDFEWDKNDSFKVNQVMEQLNKPALIKTLKKDLSLLMMKGLDKNSEAIAEKNSILYHRFTLEKGYAYYVAEGKQLKEIDNTGKHKRVTKIALTDKAHEKDMPDAVLFKHYKAHFTIQLNKIEQHADE